MNFWAKTKQWFNSTPVAKQIIKITIILYNDRFYFSSCPTSDLSEQESEIIAAELSSLVNSGFFDIREPIWLWHGEVRYFDNYRDVILCGGHC